MRAIPFPIAIWCVRFFFLLFFFCYYFTPLSFAHLCVRDLVCHGFANRLLKIFTRPHNNVSFLCVDTCCVYVCVCSKKKNTHNASAKMEKYKKKKTCLCGIFPFNRTSSVTDGFRIHRRPFRFDFLALRSSLVRSSLAFFQQKLFILSDPYAKSTKKKRPKNYPYDSRWFALFAWKYTRALQVMLVLK